MSCNHDCNQGRDCPARVAQVAQVGHRYPAHPEPLKPMTWRDYLGDLARAMAMVIAVWFGTAFGISILFLF